jgi:uncharacterized protein (TIGR00255 family)
MIRSMTAFAGADQETEGWLLAWEIRTVNHRFLDIALRLPDAFRFLESEIRARIGQDIKRGRVECTLSWKKTEQGEAAIQINPALVKQLLLAAREVELIHGSPMASVSAFDVLQWPGVLHQPEVDRDRLGQEALGLLDQTLGRLLESRETEGRQLAALVEQRCLGIRELVVAARARLPAVQHALRGRLQAKLAEISVTPDHDRLEQELVYMAQKLDVAEELDRLDTHIGEALRILKQKEPVGRRLDFLLQEFNREANTLGAKSADAETTRISVEMKVLIEQVREQIQNLE